MDTTFIETARSCFVNGERLVSDAKLLSDPHYEFLSDDENSKWKPTSLALVILAEEEFAKGFLLFLIGQGIIPWSNGVRRAARDHSSKHLLSALMEYARRISTKSMLLTTEFGR